MGVKLLSENMPSSMGVPESWCAEAFDEEKIKSDSIVNRNMDIYTEDIRLFDS